MLHLQEDCIKKQKKLSKILKKTSDDLFFELNIFTTKQQQKIQC